MRSIVLLANYTVRCIMKRQMYRRMVNDWTVVRLVDNDIDVDNRRVGRTVEARWRPGWVRVVLRGLSARRAAVSIY